MLTEANSGRLRAAARNLFMLLGEKLPRPCPTRSSRTNVKPPGSSDSGNRRRRKRERNALPEAGEFLVHALADELILLFPLLPFLPFLQRHEEECVVARPRKTEQAEADDAGRRFDAGRLRQQFLDLARGRFRPLQRRGAGKLQIDEHVALVLIRQKARGQPGAEEAREAAAMTISSTKRNGALADQRAGNAYVAVGRASRNPVEPVEEPSQQTPALSARPQQQRRQSAGSA